MSEKPFYVYPVGQTRGIQIIREVKAEIKKMETHRPSTPFNGKRKPGFSSRPSSNISIKSLQYEVPEKLSLLNVKVESHSNRKEELHELKLEPIVQKTNLNIRNYNISPKNQKLKESKAESNSEFLGFPPIVDKNAEQSSSLNVDKSIKNLPVNAHDCESSSLGDLPDVDSHYTSYYETYSHPTEHEISDTTLECSDIESKNNIQEHSSVSKSKEYRVSCEFSVEMANLLPQLSRLVKQGMKKVDEIMELVDVMYSSLKQYDLMDKEFDERVPILRELFRLMSSNNPSLRFKIAKIVLEMKITDRNLVNVLKIILKLTKVESINLNDSDTFDCLLKGISDTSLDLNRDAVHYSILIFKHFIGEKFIDKLTLTEHILPILFQYLSDFNLMSYPTDVNRTFEYLIVDIATIVYNLVDYQSDWNVTLEEEQISLIMKTLNKCIHFKDVVQILVRIISKVAEKSDGCNVIALCNENIPEVLMPLFIEYKYDLDIFLQLAFVVGNLVSIDDKQALDFITWPDFQNTLLSILEEYVQYHTQESSALKNKLGVSSGDQNWNHLIVEAILQNLHVWANLCLSTKAGSILANDNAYISRLLSITALYQAKISDSIDYCMVLSSLLVVIGNTAYYLSSDSKEVAVNITENIIRLLDNCHPFELRLEAASIVRNLTRSSDVRAFIREHSLYRAFIQLLDENDKDLRTIAYGIMMNILVDQEACYLFYEEQGISRVLHKLHLCSGRDWKISAHLCQILWNFCSNKGTTKTSISKMEVAHLIKFLSYSIAQDEKKEPGDEAYESSEEYSWKVEFCSVAKQLLNLLNNDKTLSS